jgi:TRAP-type C4-dicarboxylate transport system permease small subunit
MMTGSVSRIGDMVISFLTKLGMYLSGIAIFLMALFITFEVVARRFLGFSTLIADEYSGYLLVFITFFGLAYTMKTKGFLQVEFVIKRLSGRSYQTLHFILLTLALFYSLVMQYELVIFTWSTYVNDIVSVSISQTPLYIPQLCMPIGMIIFILELGEQWCRAAFALFPAVNSDSSERDNK